VLGAAGAVQATADGSPITVRVTTPQRSLSVGVSIKKSRAVISRRAPSEIARYAMAHQRRGSNRRTFSWSCAARARRGLEL